MIGTQLCSSAQCSSGSSIKYCYILWKEGLTFDNIVRTPEYPCIMKAKLNYTNTGARHHIVEVATLPHCSFRVATQP